MNHNYRKTKFIIILFMFAFIYIHICYKTQKRISSTKKLSKLIDISVKNGRHAVISVDLDTDLDFYLFYLPITCLSWRLIGFEPLILAIYSDGTKNNSLVGKTVEYLEFFKIKIIYLKNIAGHNKMLGMLARLLVGLVDQNDIHDDAFIFQSDADLLPINKSYYNKFDETNSIKVLDVSSFQTPMGKFSYKGKKYRMFYMGHIGMRKKQWREIMNFNDNQTNFQLNSKSILNMVKEYYGESKIKKDEEIVRGDSVWSLDQFILSINIARYLRKTRSNLFENPSNGIKLDREWTDSKWMDVLKNKYDMINDVHLFHDNYLEKLHLLELLLTKMFKIEDNLILKRYTREFVDIKNTKWPNKVLKTV